MQVGVRLGAVPKWIRALAWTTQEWTSIQPLELLTEAEKQTV